MLSSIWRKFCLGLISIAALTIFFTGIFLALANKDHVVLGVRYEGQPLGGMSESQAREFFSQVAAEKLAKGAIVLTQGDNSWPISAEAIALTADVDEAATAAYSVGRGKGWALNLKEQLQSLIHGHDIYLTATVNDAALSEQLFTVAVAVDQQPVNAMLTISSDGTVNHIAGHDGYYLDTGLLADKLKPNLIALDLPAKQEIELAVQPPFVKNEDVAPIDTVLAAYTTYFGGNANRNENIRIAAGELSGILVKSGQSFSFNEAVGSRVPSAGYKTATVIVEGRMQQDIGGGVCQVSSTLYNAILLAGLTPTVRTSHFYPSAYVPAGLDATVADGQIDFQFKNTLPHNVYLLSSVYGSALTIYVLGTWADLGGSTISLETATERTTPAPVISVYRLWQQGGQTTNREYLHTDSYAVPPPVGT